MADEAAHPDTQTPADTDQPTAAHSGKKTLAVKVYAPFQIYFEGEASSVSAVNATGPFDVLPRHHNFLCMLVPCTLKIQAPAGPRNIKVSRALLRVNDDRVVVFMDV